MYTNGPDCRILSIGNTSMKLTRKQLVKLIKEELGAIEEVDDSPAGAARKDKEDAEFAKTRAGIDIRRLYERDRKTQANMRYFRKRLDILNQYVDKLAKIIERRGAPDDT